jgi:hypothetical protein
MKTNRIFDYSQEVVKDALRTLTLANKKERRLKDEITKSPEQLIEVAKRIEDFAEIISNNGFDANTQRHLTIDDLNIEMEDFTREHIKDFSLNALGFVVTQTITRLVTKMQTPEIDAWMFASQDLILQEGTTIYNVIIGDAHGTSRVAEGGEYNSFSLDSTEDYIKTTGKIGIKASFSEEASRRCGASAIAMLTEAALRDMKRFKSVEAIRLLEANAKTVMDGLKGTAGYAPAWDATAIAPTGVSRKTQTKNGSLLLSDMESIIADTQNSGYDVDVIFINPLALRILTSEPSVREYLEKTANMHFLVPKRKASVARNLVTKLKQDNAKGVKGAEGQEFAIPSAMLMNKQFNIVVTPIVKFHKSGEAIYTPASRYGTTKVTLLATAPTACSDVIFVDSSRALTHVHDGRGIMSDRIENNLRDVTDIKFKEYYSFLLDKDHGVFAARNITVTTDVFDPKLHTHVTIAATPDMF